MPPVHVYVATVEESRKAGALSRYQARLSEEDRTRHARMRAEPRGDEFLVGRALIRHALAIHAPGTPPRLRVESHGRLQLEGPSSVRFNLSHASGLVVCAVAAGVDIGVDIELVDARRADDTIWERYFAPPEVAALAALPPDSRAERFFAYWTLKEAYIKARGLGLAIPLHQFWFRIEPGAPIRIAFAPEMADEPERWQFLQQKLGPDYWLALAVASSHESIATSIEHCIP